jgi:hypothetical protein
MIALTIIMANWYLKVAELCNGPKNRKPLIDFATSNIIKIDFSDVKFSMHFVFGFVKEFVKPWMGKKWKEFQWNPPRPQLP